MRGGVTCRARMCNLSAKANFALACVVGEGWGAHACLKRSAWDQEIAYLPTGRDEMASREGGTITSLRPWKVGTCQSLRSHDHNRQPVIGHIPSVQSVLPHNFFFFHLTCPVLLAPSFSRRTQKETTRNETITTGPVLVHMGLASLCISNSRAHFINNLTSRSVYGRGSQAIRSSSSSAASSFTTTDTTNTTSSTYARPTWRHASSAHRFFRTYPIRIYAYHAHPTNLRTASWAAKFNLRPSSGSPNDADTHEELSQEALLEAIKGRQQTDLMLRCKLDQIRPGHIAVSQTRSSFFFISHP